MESQPLNGHHVLGGDNRGLHHGGREKLDSLTMDVLVSPGRFSDVYKGTLGDKSVAIKV